MIPVAAFAVTVTGASAFSSEMLEKLDINLTNDQVIALEEAHELKIGGADRDEIKLILENAGLDKEVMKEIHKVSHAERAEHRKAIKAAIDSEDYEAYLEAVADTPRADLIDSESKFEKLVEAHQLREAGNHEAAKEIMEDLGFQKPAGHGFGGGHKGSKEGKGFGPSTE